MKRKLTSILLLSAVLLVGTSTFTSCKDWDSDEIAYLQEQVTDLNTVIETQITAIQTNSDAIEAEAAARESEDEALSALIDLAQDDADEAIEKAKQALDELDALSDELDALSDDTDAKISELSSDIDEIEETIANTYVTVEGLNSTIENLECVADLVERVEALEGDVTTIYDEIEAIKEDLENATCDCSDDLAEVRNTANTALTLAQSDSIRLDEIEALIAAGFDFDDTEIQNELTLLNSTVAANSTSIDSLASVVSSNMTLANTYKDMVDSVIIVAANNAAEIATINGTISTLCSTETMQNTVSAAAEELQSEIDSLSKALCSLEGKFNILNNALASLITSINIDQISNPVFGSLNLPFGIKSTVLCAFYGTTSGDVSFPNHNSAYYVDEEMVDDWTLSSSAYSYIETVNDDEGVITTGYAGTLYLTVNPGDVDLDNVQMRLASRSTDENAPAYPAYFSLSKSSASVTTRSVDADNNGAYESAINVDTDLESLQEAQVDVNETELAGALQDVLYKLQYPGTAISLMEVVQDVYSNFKSAVSEYYAVKCEWEEEQEDGTIKERSVRSDYEIAALTAKPLSYATLYDKEFSYSLTSKFPVIEELGMEVISVNYDPIDTADVDDITITISLSEEDFDITLTDEETGAGYVTINGEDYEVTLYFDNYTVEADDITIVVSLQQVRDIMEQMNEQMLDMVDDINEQVQALIEDINENYISLINNYLNKASDILSYYEEYVNHPNTLWLPSMVWSLDGNYGRLSETELAPSVFTVSSSEAGALSLIASSYTAELLCPAYKKWVQVSTIEGDGEATLTNGEEEGDGLLLDGKENALVLKADAGSTYQIVYSAVDYYGKVAAKKYYIQVK